MGFNPYNVDTILYGAPIYSDIYICPHLGYWIGAYIKLLTFVWFFCALIIYPVFCMCEVYGFIFMLDIFVY